MKIHYIAIVLLTTFEAETIVHVIIPIVISTTDKYLENPYCFLRIKIPIIMLAIRDPCNKQ